MLKEKERQLFQRWKAKQGYTAFISDGIFDEFLWREQSIKITFVLKEANWENGNIDLCQWLLEEHKGSYWKTWNNIARWTQALMIGGDYPYHVSKADKTYWLSRVSFLNLKKIGGTHQTNNNILREFAAKDAQYIWEQLSLYTPDIIVCCGWWIVADILYRNVLPKERVGPWKKTDNGFDFFDIQFEDRATSTPVISFYHPQRIASHKTFEEWYDAMRNISNILLTQRSI